MVANLLGTNDSIDNVIRLGIIVLTVAVGIFIDILIWPFTSEFWRENVHKVFLEQKVDAGWAEGMTWILLDGIFAVLIIGGIGVMLASGTVSWVVSKLGMR